MSRSKQRIHSGDVRNAILFTSLVGAALLAAASRAQTPTWGKANTGVAPLRILNGTKGYVVSGDGKLMRAYDMVNGKYLTMPRVKLNDFANRPISVSDDGKRFLIHNLGTDTEDYVLRMNGTTPVAYPLPSQLAVGNGKVVYGSTTLSHDGKYVFQLWENGLSNWYDAATGTKMGTAFGPIVEVAPGQAAAQNVNGNIRLIDLSTGNDVLVGFPLPQQMLPIVGRGGLLVLKSKFSSDNYCFDFNTGKATPLTLYPGETIAGVFSDGKTIAINNPDAGQAYVQKVGQPRKFVSSWIQVSPDGTRGILQESGTERPVYNPGNDTTFSVEEADYSIVGFDASKRAILNVSNRLLRTISTTGASVYQQQLPSLPAGAKIRHLSPDMTTLVYQTDTEVRQVYLPNMTDSLWFKTDVVKEWSQIYSEDGKRVIVWRTNSDAGIVNYRVYGAIGANYAASTLPWGTIVRGFSPDGRLLCTQALNGKAWIRYHDVGTGALKKSIPAGSGTPFVNFALSGDGNTIAMQTLEGYRLINATTGTVKNVGGQAADSDIFSPQATITLSYDGSLMSLGPRVYRTSNYTAVLNVPTTSYGRGMIARDNLSFVYANEMGVERYALPATP